MFYVTSSFSRAGQRPGAAEGLRDEGLRHTERRQGWNTPESAQTRVEGSHFSLQNDLDWTIRVHAVLCYG